MQSQLLQSPLIYLDSFVYPTGQHDPLADFLSDDAPFSCTAILEP